MSDDAQFLLENQLQVDLNVVAGGQQSSVLAKRPSDYDRISENLRKYRKMGSGLAQFVAQRDAVAYQSSPVDLIALAGLMGWAA